MGPIPACRPGRPWCGRRPLSQLPVAQDPAALHERVGVAVRRFVRSAEGGVGEHDGLELRLLLAGLGHLGPQAIVYSLYT